MESCLACGDKNTISCDPPWFDRDTCVVCGLTIERDGGLHYTPMAGVDWITVPEGCLFVASWGGI